MPRRDDPRDGSAPFPPPITTDRPLLETLDDVFACQTRRHRRHLVEAGVVSLDDGTRSVGKGDRFDVAASVLEVV